MAKANREHLATPLLGRSGPLPPPSHRLDGRPASKDSTPRPSSSNSGFKTAHPTAIGASSHDVKGSALSSRSSTSSMTGPVCAICKTSGSYSKVLKCTSCGRQCHKKCDDASDTSAVDSWRCSGCRKKTNSRAENLSNDETTHGPYAATVSLKRSHFNFTPPGPRYAVDASSDATRVAASSTGFTAINSRNRQLDQSGSSRTSSGPPVEFPATASAKSDTNAGKSAVQRRHRPKTAPEASDSTEILGGVAKDHAAGGTQADGDPSSPASRKLLSRPHSRDKPCLSYADLALLVLFEAPGHETTVRSAVEWVAAHIDGYDVKDEKLKRGLGVWFSQSAKKDDPFVTKSGDESGSQAHSWHVVPNRHDAFIQAARNAMSYYEIQMGRELKNKRRRPQILVASSELAHQNKRFKADLGPGDEEIKRLVAPATPLSPRDHAPVQSPLLRLLNAPKDQRDTAGNTTSGLGKLPDTSDVEMQDARIESAYKSVEKVETPVSFSVTIKTLETEVPQKATELHQIRAPRTVAEYAPAMLNASCAIGSSASQPPPVPGPHSVPPAISIEKEGSASEELQRFKQIVQMRTLHRDVGLPARPQRSSSNPVPLEEIKARPTRKQLIKSGKSYMTRSGQNKALNLMKAFERQLVRPPPTIADAVARAAREERRTALELDLNNSQPVLFDTLEELFEMPDKLKPIIHDGELAFMEVKENKTGRPERTKNIFRIGAAAREAKHR